MTIKGAHQKSPKFKHAMKREAEKNQRRAKAKTCHFKSVQEALKK